ncbi:hypothetical protein K0M31_004932 [Melipona bicolor]|uniref:Uncharacterized protein n=1 Tax=Melipona bicolor TaxID=60889 RepID=A0AA40FWC1_9HYME|nr:hypothetical protein K0M31_004932 [Melipona bicolor]
MKQRHRRRIDNVLQRIHLDGEDERRRFRVQRFDHWSYPACINDAYVQFGGPQFLALLILSSKEKVRECERKRRSFPANGNARKNAMDVRSKKRTLAGEAVLSFRSGNQNIPDRRIRGKRSARNITHTHTHTHAHTHTHTHTKADFTVGEMLMKRER